MTVSFYRIEKVVNFVNICLQGILIREIEHKSDREHTPNILLSQLAEFLDVEKQLVFACNACVVLKVIDKRLLPVFAEEVILDVRRNWAPLQVEQ